MTAPPFHLALVTGASAGIGRALARELASRGTNLILVARTRSALEAVSAELAAPGLTIHVECADLSVPGEASRLAARCEERGWHVDLLVNNAGAAVATAEQLAHPDRVAAALQLNIVAPVELSLALGAAMQRRGTGAILNIGSLTAYVGAPLLRTYGSSKRFIQSFSEELRAELEPAGVSVTTLVPGLTRTGWFEHAGIPFDEDAARALRMMEPEDVARIGIDAAVARVPLRFAGAHNRWLARATELLPRALTRRLIARSRKRLHPTPLALPPAA